MFSLVEVIFRRQYEAKQGLLSMDETSLKKLVGYKACDDVRPGMTIGVGTGSTVFYFIEKLAFLHREGLSVKAICSSTQSEHLIQQAGIPLVPSDEITHIDLTVDGADEINPLFHMIKGGGGALFREKLLATHSRQMTVIIDHTKWVTKLGSRKTPVEILPFCHPLTCREIEKLGLKGSLRKKPSGDIYVTDNHNYIFDIAPTPVDAPSLHSELIQITGVVETGLFFDVATKILMSYPDGKVIEKSP